MDTPTGLPATPIDLAQAFGIDPRQSAPTDAAQAATLAQEFEAMLMLQMVRQMRQSLLSEEDQEQGLGNDRWTETFDVEFSRYLTQKGGVGLSEFIRSQLDAKAGGAGAGAGAAMAGAGAGDPAKATTAAGSVAAGHAAGATGVPVGAPTAASRPALAVPAAVSTVPVSTAVMPAAATAVATDEAASAADERGGRAAIDAAGARTVASAAADADDENLTMPLDSATTSAFGWRGDPFHGRRRFHSGVDLRAAYGTEVPAAGAGRVTFAGERGGYGTLVIVQHDDGVETRYAHLSATDVRAGDTVASGQLIGRVGSSGRSTAPHLHFEVLVNGARVDPTLVAGKNLDQFKFVRAVVD